ncbi:hypothetical protein, partial [Legionella moravica]
LQEIPRYARKDVTFLMGQPWSSFHGTRISIKMTSAIKYINFLPDLHSRGKQQSLAQATPTIS